jgi:hypothetical protein
MKFPSIIGLYILTIYGVWSGNETCCTLLRTARDCISQFPVTHKANSHVFTAVARKRLSGFQRRRFHFLWVPELSPCLSYSKSNSRVGLHTSQIITRHANSSSGLKEVGSLQLVRLSINVSNFKEPETSLPCSKKNPFLTVEAQNASKALHNIS